MTRREPLKGIEMTEIKAIKAYIETGNGSGAGTNSRVYLGIGGREFYVDASGNVFEAGAKETFVFGAGATVTDPEYNNPVQPQMYTEYLNESPVYLRSDDSGNASAWEVANVQVSIHTDNGDQPVAIYINRLLHGNDATIWLGTNYGLRLDLTRVHDA